MMATTTLTVKGMHCNACEKLIKEVLEEEGASAVKIDYKTGKVIVTHESGLTKEKMAKAIVAEGYGVA